jgi:hypothetical protein
MKRKDAINHILIAGYHGDNAAYTRLYIENRVSLDVAKAAFKQGTDMKEAGVGCSCSACNPKNHQPTKEIHGT